MNDRTMMWLLVIAGVYLLYNRSASAAPFVSGKPITTDPATAGLNFDPLTGGWCYPPGYTGSMIGPYPSC